MKSQIISESNSFSGKKVCNKHSNDEINSLCNEYQKLSDRNEPRAEAVFVEICDCLKGLVLKIARKYPMNNVEEEDVLTAGAEGILNALKKYDSEMGPFVTFAWKYIKGELSELCKWNNMPAATLPQGMRRKIKMYDDYIGDSSNLSYEEKAQIIGCEVKYVPIIEASRNLTASYVKDVDDTEEVLAYSTAFSPEKKVEEEANKEILKRALSELNDQQRKVVCMREGYDTDRAYTKKEIAESLNITEDRVGRLYEQGIRMLKTKYFTLVSI